MSTWRDHIRPAVRQVIRENQDKPEKEIRRALNEARKEVIGMAQYYPYQVWLEEVRGQLDALYGRVRDKKSRVRNKKGAPLVPNQISLFEEG